VIDAGIDPELVEEDHTLFFCLGIERRHLLLDVGGRDHVLTLVEAGPRHLWVKLPGQQAHRHIMFGDDRLELFRLDGDVECHRRPVGMAIEDVLRLAHRTAGDGDVKTIIEQIPNMGADHQPGSEYHNSFHVRVLSQWPLAATLSSSNFCSVPKSRHHHGLDGV